MFRPSSSILLLIAAALLCAPGLVPGARAQSECQRTTPGKCGVGQTAIPKSKSGAVTRQATQPPSVSHHKGREKYTAAEREKFMERARKLCREKYGAPSTVYRVDYKRLEVWCTPASY